MYYARAQRRFNELTYAVCSSLQLPPRIDKRDVQRLEVFYVARSERRTVLDTYRRNLRIRHRTRATYRITGCYAFCFMRGASRVEWQDRLGEILFKHRSGQSAQALLALAIGQSLNAVEDFGNGHGSSCDLAVPAYDIQLCNNSCIRRRPHEFGQHIRI